MQHIGKGRLVAESNRWQRLANWAYADTGSRDLRVDFLRGYAVFAMVIDHLGGESWLHAITGGNQFFVSAAEGFVFISGLMVGLIYGRRLDRDGVWPTVQKLLLRSWTLYTLAIWLALSTAFLAALFDLPRGVIFSADPASFVMQVLTVRRTFYLVDVMLFYTLAMLVAPLALLALRRGFWWLVAFVSVSLWLAYQVWPNVLQVPWHITDNPVFNFAPWQLLFFSALLLGYYRDQISHWLLRPALTRWLTVPVLVLVLSLMAGLIVLQNTNGRWFAAYVPDGDTGAWLDRWFDKSALPLPRLLACAVIFAFLWLVVHWLWVPLRKGFGWFLMPLGQGALYAYGAHLYIVILAQLLVLHLWGKGQGSGYGAPNGALNLLIQLAGVGWVWVLTRIHFLSTVIAPLGSTPVATFRTSRSTRFWLRPGDSLLALLLVFVLTAPFVWPLGLQGGIALRSGQATAGKGSAPAQGGTSSQPALVAPPASTVTAPRSVAGSARGSSGLTGRNDQQPGASAAPTSRPVPGLLPAASSAPANTSGSEPPARTISGGYLKDDAFFSHALGETMPYGIYLPPSYDSDPQRRYPVVYMLHGVGGHYSEWVAYGLPEKAEDLIWDGQIQPLIIVMPQGDQSYFINHDGADGKRWGDYIAYDLIAHIDANYRTIPEAASRAIGGLSMGGFGALQLALEHPDVFSAVGGHSPALRTVQQLDDILGPDVDPDLHDPVEIARKIDLLHIPAIWVDAGANDGWADRVAQFGAVLDQRGITHQVRLQPGQHDGAYWQEHTADYLLFYSRSIVGGPVASGTIP